MKTGLQFSRVSKDFDPPSVCPDGIMHTYAKFINGNIHISPTPGEGSCESSSVWNAESLCLSVWVSERTISRLLKHDSNMRKPWKKGIHIHLESIFMPLVSLQKVCVCVCANASWRGGQILLIWLCTHCQVLVNSIYSYSERFRYASAPSKDHINEPSEKISHKAFWAHNCLVVQGFLLVNIHKI